METIPTPDHAPHEPPNDNTPAGDVREPPLPHNEGAKDNFPSDTDLIEPDEGGGRIKKKAT